MGFQDNPSAVLFLVFFIGMVLWFGLGLYIWIRKQDQGE